MNPVGCFAKKTSKRDARARASPVRGLAGLSQPWIFAPSSRGLRLGLDLDVAVTALTAAPAPPSQQGPRRDLPQRSHPARAAMTDRQPVSAISTMEMASLSSLTARSPPRPKATPGGSPMCGGGGWLWCPSYRCVSWAQVQPVDNHDVGRDVSAPPPLPDRLQGLQGLPQDADPESCGARGGRDHPDSFAGSIRHALLLGHAFSMLQPELGPPPEHPGGVAAAWLVRAAYAGVVVAGLCFLAMLSLHREMTSDSLWDSSVDMMFFGSSAISTVLFMDVGRRWRCLAAAFRRIEHRLFEYGYPANQRSAMKRLTCFVMLGASVEHILSVWSALDYVWPCYKKTGSHGAFKAYSALKFPMVFPLLDYEPWKAAATFLLNFVATFFWNFNHLFVMLISMPLTGRFKQLNGRLQAVSGQVMPDSFWRHSREVYNELSLLTKQVDHAVGKLVVLSYASNMYFICRQLLHSFRQHRDSIVYDVYFMYSFGYMLMRTVLVSLFAASVHEESRKPLTVLFGVPAGGFTAEVERFMNQVSRDHVAITGCRFFSVTRGLILTVAGTIISYEIVLMQLHPAAQQQPTPHPVTPAAVAPPQPQGAAASAASLECRLYDICGMCM